MCVKDHEPRKLIPFQEKALQTLAQQVMTHLELQRHTRELLRTKEQLHLVTDNARVGLVILDENRRYIYANKTYAEILNLPSSQIIGRSVPEILGETYPDQIQPHLDRAFSGERVGYELRKTGPSGIHHYAVRYEPIRQDGKKMVVVVITEITDRKKADEDLREADRFAHSTIDSLSAHICVLDDQGIILDTNRAWQEFALANSVSEVTSVGANYLRISDHAQGFDAAGGMEFAEGIRSVIRGDRSEFTMEYPCHSPREKRWFVGRVTRFPEGKSVRVVVAHENITQRKEAEILSQRLAAIVSSSDDAIIGKNLDSTIVSWNKGAEKLFGYTSNDMIGTSIMRLIPQDRWSEESFILEKIGHGESVEHFETQRQTKDGRLIDVSVTASPILDSSGKVIGISKVARDVTEKKKALERIAEQAAFLDKARDAILVRDLSGKILFWNEGARRIYGWSSLEAVGFYIGKLLYSDPARFEELNQTTIEKGEWNGEIQHLTKDGSTLSIEARWTLIRDQEGNPKSILAINTDITDKKKIEVQFLRAQRMESIGTLAGGIAHDLNNILSPIMMSIELLKMLVDEPRAQNLLDTIEISSKRGADIVRQVLSFARGLEGERSEIQAKHLLKDLEQIIKDTFPKNIDLRFDVPREIWTILGDPTQVHQILLNLCVNARDAMPHGGSLTVGVENATLDEQYAAMNLQAKPGRYVMIRVTDSGTGMPPELLDKIFEPFFTTKELNKGTGLGLSTVMAIVKSHEGIINVYSEPGRGTTFKVYLPAASFSGERRTEELNILPRGHGETILVVDDEASILNITSQTLQAYGYRVLTAPDGAFAVVSYAQHRTEISLVLTDMMMPVMDGPTTITALMRINPEIKIIAASGLNANGGVAKVSGMGVKNFLTKPYTAGTLLKMLRKVLDS